MSNFERTRRLALLNKFKRKRRYAAKGILYLSMPLIFVAVLRVLYPNDVSLSLIVGFGLLIVIMAGAKIAYDDIIKLLEKWENE